jgi:hypothetical protein
VGFKLAEAFVELTVHEQKMRAGLSKAQGYVSGFVSKYKQQLSDIRSFGAKVFLPLVAGGAGLLKLASDAEEMESKFRAVFKDQADSAQVFSENLAKSTNRSALELRDFMSSIQSVLVPMGFARKEASDYSGALTQLAVDLASFNNASESETIRDLTSALVGNHETVRKFGVSITESVLNQQLLAMGFKKTTQGATEQQKVMARMAIIMNSTKDAQGDAVRTADGFANTFRGLTARAKEAAIMFGKELLPIGHQLVSWASSAVEWFRQLDEGQKSLAVRAGVLVAAISGALVVLPTLTLAIGSLTAVLTVLAGPAGMVGLLVAGLGLLAVAVHQAATDWDNWGASIARVTAALTGVDNAVSKLDKEMSFEDKARATNEKIDARIKAASGTAGQGAAVRSALKDLNALDIVAGGAGEAGATQMKLNNLKRKSLLGMLPEADRLSAVEKGKNDTSAAIDQRNKEAGASAKKRVALRRFGMNSGDAADVLTGTLMGGAAGGIKAMFASSTKAKEEAEKASEKRRDERAKQRERDKSARSGFAKQGVDAAEGRALMAGFMTGGLASLLPGIEKVKDKKNEKDFDASRFGLSDINKRLQKGGLEQDEKADRKKSVKALETIAGEGVKVKNFKDFGAGIALFGA